MNDETSEPGSLPVRVPRFRLRKRWLALAVFGGLLLIACVWYALRRAPPEPPPVDLTGGDPEVARAVRDARDAVLASPRSAKAWGRLGMILLAHGYQAEAVQALAEAERLDSHEPRWPYLQGLALQRGDPERALPKLRRALQLSQDSRLCLRLAEGLLAQGQLDEAEALLHQVERAGQENARVETGLAQVARARGDPVRCLEHLRRALNSPGVQTKTVHALMAEVYGQLPGKEAQAERERETVVDLPNDAAWPDPYYQEVLDLRVGMQARIERADVLRRSGQLKHASALLVETTRLYPDSDMVWLQLGGVLLQARDYRGAERALREAIRLGPSRFESQYRLGIALFAQRARRPGGVAEATRVFRRASLLAPTVHLAPYRLGLCLREQGDREGAISALRAALRCRPDYAVAHRSLGELLTEIAREAATVACLQRLFGYPAAFDVAVFIRVQALAHLRYAAQLVPQDPGTKQALDRLGAEFPQS
jgi:tetratricopeptide (TPR) repeat protein